MTLTKSPDNTMTHSSPTGTPAVSTHVPSAKKKQNSTPETKMRPTQRSTPQKHIDSNQPKLSETVASSEDGEIPCLQTIKKIPKKNVTGFKNPGMIRLNSSVDFDHEPEPVEHDTEPVDPETVPTVNPPGQNATTSEPFIDLTGQGTQEAELRPADRLSHSQNDDGISVLATVKHTDDIAVPAEDTELQKPLQVPLSRPCVPPSQPTTTESLSSPGHSLKSETDRAILEELSLMLDRKLENFLKPLDVQHPHVAGQRFTVAEPSNSQRDVECACKTNEVHVLERLTAIQDRQERRSARMEELIRDIAKLNDRALSLSEQMANEFLKITWGTGDSGREDNRQDVCGPAQVDAKMMNTNKPRPEDANNGKESTNTGIADPLLGDGRPTSTSTDREMPAAASSVNIITDEHIPDGTTMAVKVPSGKILGYMRVSSHLLKTRLAASDFLDIERDMKGNCFVIPDTNTSSSVKHQDPTAPMPGAPKDGNQGPAVTGHNTGDTESEDDDIYAYLRAQPIVPLDDVPSIMPVPSAEHMQGNTESSHMQSSHLTFGLSVDEEVLVCVPGGLAISATPLGSAVSIDTPSSCKAGSTAVGHTDIEADNECRSKTALHSDCSFTGDKGIYNAVVEGPVDVKNVTDHTAIPTTLSDACTDSEVLEGTSNTAETNTSVCSEDQTISNCVSNGGNNGTGLTSTTKLPISTSKVSEVLQGKTTTGPANTIGCTEGQAGGSCVSDEIGLTTAEKCSINAFNICEKAQLHTNTVAADPSLCKEGSTGAFDVSNVGNNVIGVTPVVAKHSDTCKVSVVAEGSTSTVTRKTSGCAEVVGVTYTVSDGTGNLNCSRPINVMSNKACEVTEMHERYIKNVTGHSSACNEVPTTQDGVCYIQRNAACSQIDTQEKISNNVAAEVIVGTEMPPVQEVAHKEVGLNEVNANTINQGDGARNVIGLSEANENTNNSGQGVKIKAKKQKAMSKTGSESNANEKHTSIGAGDPMSENHSKPSRRNNRDRSTRSQKTIVVNRRVTRSSARRKAPHPKYVDYV